jgi:hypothetical protein
VTDALAFAPWARTREESELDYGHFRIWLDLQPRPVPRDPALAIRHNWAERATSFDAYNGLAGLNGREAALEIFKMWSVTVLNESRKWLSKSLREDREPSLEPQRIEDFIALVTDPARNQAGRSNHDLAKLAPERAALLLELLEEMKVES